MPADDVSDRWPEESGDPVRSDRGTASPGSRQFRFRRAHRLLHRRDFDRVLRGGRRRSLPELVVVTSEPGLRGRMRETTEPAGTIGSRLGITVGRKAGSSVERNRFKRRVREWFRRQRKSLDPALDIVVIARRSAVDLSFEELSGRLTRLLAANKSQVSGIKREKR